MDDTWHQHRLANRLQTWLLMLTLVGVSVVAGWMILDEPGALLALGASLVALLAEPTAAARLTLRLYRARPLLPAEAPQLWAWLQELARRAGLPAVPTPYLVPSAVVNAFAVGSRQQAAVAVTEGLLRSLTPREFSGVLAHEVAHIAHEDLRVMGLADYISRLTAFFALVGQLSLLLALPWLLAGSLELNWFGLLLLAVSPHLAMLAQLGLSRTREFDADLAAARLTGDPQGLASALAKIERVSRGLRAWLMPGWGNPEPSWLRTHPATEERIQRLLSLAGTAVSRPRALDLAGPAGQPRRQPRWYPGGYWR